MKVRFQFTNFSYAERRGIGFRCIGPEAFLHLACSRGHMAACECLIFNRGDLKAGDIQGQTPLNLAEKAGHRLLVNAMKQHLWAGLGR